MTTTTTTLPKSRPLTLSFTNSTDEKLTFKALRKIHGTPLTVGSMELGADSKANTTNVFTKEESFFGPEGFFQWELPPRGDKSSPVFVFYYRHPIAAEPTLVLFVAIPGGFDVITTQNGLAHHSASASYSLERI